MMLKRLNNLVKQENETVREFHDKFETLFSGEPSFQTKE
jgi:hypothetical protein